ncbi:MAG: DUF302 domain-containing protein [Gammaproteobacteria bacterium]|jgi:uncharacterized protein (DUF302 family)
MKHYLLLLLIITTTGLHAETMGNANPINQKTAISNDLKRYTAFGEFDEIKAFLVSAIEERGIKISSTSYISKMLQRTGEDIGDTQPIYKNAEAIEFCSATLSREMMQANPHNIAFCPYTILIYELAKDPGTTYLSFRRPFYQADEANHESQTKVDELLSRIIEEVVE